MSGAAIPVYIISDGERPIRGGAAQPVEVINLVAGGGGGISSIVEDTTPQLGGNLDLNGNVITGLVIGTNVQAFDAGLTDLAGLSVADGNIPVGDGANWVAESGATARTSLGAAALGANTFTGEQTLADNLLTRPVLKDYGEAINALGSVSGTVDIDLEDGNIVTATITGATTFTFSNPPASGTYGGFVLYLTNGGANVTWPAAARFAGGIEPTLTAAGVDRLAFDTVDAGTNWDGFAAGLDMS